MPDFTATTLAEAMQALLTEIEEKGACMARLVLYAKDGTTPLMGLVLIHGPDAEEVMAHLDLIEGQWDHGQEGKTHG
jgi:hypothetical protein